MPRNLYLILLVIVGFTPLLQAQKFIPSKKSPIKFKTDLEYTFGYLEVPENRLDPNSRLIELPVYIFKSKNVNPQPDPIIFTAGGPGSTSLTNVPYAKYWAYLNNRDLIFFEQRGTQYAKPHLSCPEWAEAQEQVFRKQLDQDASSALLREAAKKCRQRLKSDKVDLNGYNTNEIAADIEDLRKTLGYEKWNLLTTSYSTKIAQVLMRDYPDGIRSVVMDSPLPLQASWDMESLDNLMGIYKQIFNDCQRDPECDRAFPDLKARFYKFLGDTDKNPIVLTRTDPQSNNQVVFHLEAQDLVQLFGYFNNYNVDEFLFELDEIVKGDTTFLAETLDSKFKSGPGSGNGTGTGMRLSVWCSEETPFIDQEVLKERLSKYQSLVGYDPRVFSEEVCRVWDVEAAKPEENEAITSDIPTLIINGQYDEVTPPHWGAQLHQNLSNSYQLIFKGLKHNPVFYWDNPCAMTAAVDFFNDPSQKPEPECLARFDEFRFRTDE